MEERIQYQWPTKVRHDFLNRNYVEFTHALAEVPFVPHIKFYSTPAEQKWAEKKRKEMGGRVVLWAMTGSSVHKVWPYVDTIIADILLTYDDVKVVLIGDEISQLAEQGWQNESRVIKACGKWDIRKALTFVDYADLVIGPETGVLNAASMKDVPKIIFMSHSSGENLTRDWKNTSTLKPFDCPCYPCHQIHHGFDPCIRDAKTGVALCQANISSERVWQAVRLYLDK